MKKIFLFMTMFAVAAGCVNRTMPKADLPEIDTTNPLLAEWNTPFQTPPFDLISVENYEPAFEDAMAVCRAELDAIINNPEKPTFYNTVVALERQGELLGRISSVFFNMLQCNTSDEIQAIAQRVQPKLVALENDANLNPVLFERVKSVYENPEFGLTAEDKVLLENTYKGFVRSGAALSDEDKELYRQYSAELSRLSLVFGQNALASTNAFSMNITDKSVVEELPDFVKQSMAEEAKSRGEKGWTLTLQYPSYLPFMMYSTNRDYKERLWMARSKVAYGGEWDNTSVVKDIVNLRLKVANLLGYETYADYVLENRMAENPTNVNSFLDELLTATKEYAVKDYEMVNKYANEHGFEGKLMPWDWTYWSEQYKNEVYSISDEIVKPYFELESVKKGVFLLANKLYGLNFTPREDIQVYHPEVTAYEVTDESGKMMAVLYLDFFPRASKRAGAWMTEFRGMKSVDGVETRPLVSLVMNFTKPTETTPSLLTFDEFETFLHEFGHALHGMLAEGTHGSLTGTSVYRD
ncbi:MAG: M3 family metallopeptidase, partial [Alistipes sp.]|nr:M3 family metallopeptidase [Alistipes sp.]